MMGNESRNNQNAKTHSTELNVKARAIELLEESIEEYLCDFISGKDFTGRTQTAQTLK